MAAQRMTIAKALNAALRKEIEHRRREREEAASALLARYKVLNAPVASSADVLPVIVRLLRGQHREQ